METPKAPISKRSIVLTVSIAAFLLVSGSAYYAFAYKADKLPKLSQVPILRQVFKGESNTLPTATEGSNAVIMTTQTATPTPTTTTTSSPTPSTDPYQGWKTDTSSSKYTIMYPPTWFNEQDTGATTTSDEIILSNENVRLPGQISNKGIFVTLTTRPVTTMPDDIDVEMFNSPVGQVNIAGLHDPNQIWTKVANLTLDGNPTVYYTNDSSTVVKNAPNYDEVYTIKRNNQFISIDFFMVKSSESNFHSEIQNILNSVHTLN